MGRRSRRHRQQQRANRQPPAPTPSANGDMQAAPETDTLTTNIALTNPIALQGGQANAEEDARSNDEQERKQDPPLPSRFIRKEADCQGENDAEATHSKEDEPKASYRNGRISMLYHKGKEMWDGAKPGEKLMAALTGVIVLVNIVYAVIGGFQWRVTSRHLDQARSEARSWVGLDETIGFRGDALTLDKDGTAHTTCRITPKNFGNYPATILRVHAELVITQDANSVMARMEEFRAKPRRGDVGHILFPGTDKITKELVISLPFSQRIMIASADDRFELYLIGYILYRDQFGHHHHTSFAYRSENPNTDPPRIRERLDTRRVYGSWEIYHANAD